MSGMRGRPEGVNLLTKSYVDETGLTGKGCSDITINRLT